MSNIIIAGSRKFPKDVFDSYMDNEDICHMDIIICGMCHGPDMWGRDWAKSRGISVLDMPAAWDDISVEGAVVKVSKHGKQYNALAGFQRNERMAVIAAENFGRLIAFWDGASKGTKDMIHLAHKYDLAVTIVEV